MPPRSRPSPQKHTSTNQAWIPGNPFLDACTCTTNCRCRRGHRVLYRKERRAREANDPDDTDARREEGEIRYVIPSDDTCQDCEHNASPRNSGAHAPAHRSTKRQQKQTRENFARLKEDLLEALDARLKSGDGYASCHSPSRPRSQASFPPGYARRATAPAPGVHFRSRSSSCSSVSSAAEAQEPSALRRPRGGAAYGRR